MAEVAQVMDIVLFDANSFYASCHQVQDPSLRNLPLIVAGDPRNRTGIVLTASYEARSFGIKTAMPLFQALRLCPQCVALPPDFSLYLDLSSKMWKIVERYTDSIHIEIMSIDECYADFSGSHLLFGSTAEIAQRVQREIWEELGLGVSVGQSYCKIFAKLASELKDPASDRKQPRSFSSISPEDLESKVWPLPVGELNGVGRKLQAQLAAHGIASIGDLARSSPAYMQRFFGVTGLTLHRWANGRDKRRVGLDNTPASHSLSRSVTLPHDITESSHVAQVLLSLADSVGRKLRLERALCRTLTLTVKDSDFRVHTYSSTLSHPTDLTEIIYRECYGLYERKHLKEKSIRLLGITLARVQNNGEQLRLFDEENAEARHLAHTVDSLRDRFGSKTMVRASQLLDLGQNILARKRK